MDKNSDKKRWTLKKGVKLLGWFIIMLGAVLDKQDFILI
jgi:hypothetical protein